LKGIYGENAAEILNRSHCQLEDALEQQVSINQQLVQEYHSYALATAQLTAELQEHINRYVAMEEMVTDPDKLADYVIQFYTYAHPVPSQSEIQEMSKQRSTLPGTPLPQQSESINLSQVPPEKRWMMTDMLEKQGLLKGKMLARD
jgi:hypothetical protein